MKNNNCQLSGSRCLASPVRRKAGCPYEVAKAVIGTVTDEGAADLRRVAADLMKNTWVPSIKASSKNNMAVYVIPDPHIGMLSHHRETGQSYDMDTAASLMLSSYKQLIGRTEKTPVGILAVVGDFLHFDGIKPVTSASGHLLDTDSRYGRMIRVGFSIATSLVNLALSRHEKVIMYIVKGNHDDVLSFSLAMSLNALYGENRRVEIDVTENPFVYIHHGKTLIGLNHGDVQAHRLAEVMASDVPDLWGASEFRYWLTGHVHTGKLSSISGCSVESFPAICPNDAWSHRRGFRSVRKICSIIYSSEYGEVTRYTVPL